MLKWCWSATSGYVSKTCMLTQNTLTNRQIDTSQQKAAGIEDVVSSDVILSFEQFLASCPKLYYTNTHTHTHTYACTHSLLYLFSDTVSTSTSFLAWSCQCPDCISVQTTSFLFTSPPVLLDSPSLSLSVPKRSLQKPAKLPCLLMLTSQLEWHTHHHLSLYHEGHLGTTTSFFHFPLFSTALWDFANFRPVHALMLSSQLFLCLPCLLPPFTVPCKVVLARPD